MVKELRPVHNHHFEPMIDRRALWFLFVLLMGAFAAIGLMLMVSS